MIINTAILIQEYALRPPFSTVFAKLAFFIQNLHHYPVLTFQNPHYPLLCTITFAL